MLKKIFLLCVLAVTQLVSAVTYQVTDVIIPVIEKDIEVEFAYINDNGQIAGTLYHDNRSDFEEAFFWDSLKGFSFIHHPEFKTDEDTFVEVDGLNNKGQLLISLEDDEKSHAYIWESKDETFHQLMLDESTPLSYANAINNEGKVIGILEPTKSPEEKARCFILDQNGTNQEVMISDVENDDFDLTPVALNDKGEALFVTMSFFTHKDFITCMTWDNGNWTELFANVEDVNNVRLPGGFTNKGDILVLFSRTDLGTYLGKGWGMDVWPSLQIWKKGANTPSYDVANNISDSVSIGNVCMNEQHQVVGYFVNKESGLTTKAFYWDEKEQIFQDILDPECEWNLTKVHGINNKGQIVAEGVRDGKPSLILLTPATHEQ